MLLCKDIWRPKHLEKLLKLHLPNRQLKVAANTTGCLFLLCTHTHTQNIVYQNLHLQASEHKRGNTSHSYSHIFNDLSNCLSPQDVSDQLVIIY